MVVVGGGLSGLTAGALLARAGRSVVVVEAADRPGGHARSINCGGFRFDPAVHLVMGGNRTGPHGPGLLHELLELLGVAERCELVAMDSFFTAHFPDLTLTVPATRTAYLEAHAERFPAERAGLTELAELSARLYAEAVRFPIRPRRRDLISLPFRFPHLVRYRHATVQQVMDRHLSDPQLQAVYAALSPYLGLPPSQASFSTWAVMMASYVDDGAYYCRGGFQRLADAFALGFQRQGGELVVGCPVERIVVAGGRATGIEVEGGRRITAPEDVATIDARQTFGTLVDPAAVPGPWTDRIRGGDVSMPVASLYLGTDLDLSALGVSEESLVYDTWDLEEVFTAGSAGTGVAASVTVPTLVDPDLAPPGQHQVVVSAAGPGRPAGLSASLLSKQLVGLAGRVIPGLADHLTFALGCEGRPACGSALPLHRIESIYGWSASPANSGPGRLPQTTPITGLHLAGHWTQPGHGIWTVCASGARAARLILDRHPGGGMVPLDL